MFSYGRSWKASINLQNTYFSKGEYLEDRALLIPTVSSKRPASASSLRQWAGKFLGKRNILGGLQELYRARPSTKAALVGGTHLKGASATAFVNAQARSASSFQFCTIRTWALVCSCRSTKAWKLKSNNGLLQGCRELRDSLLAIPAAAAQPLRFPSGSSHLFHVYPGHHTPCAGFWLCPLLLLLGLFSCCYLFPSLRWILGTEVGMKETGSCRLCSQ